MAGECCEITADSSTVTVCRHNICHFVVICCTRQSIILSIAFSTFPNNISCGDVRSFTRRCCTVAHLQQNTAHPVLRSSLQQHILVLPFLSYTPGFLDLLFIFWRTPNEKVQLWAHQVRLVCPPSCNNFRTGEQISIEFGIVSLIKI